MAPTTVLTRRSVTRARTPTVIWCTPASRMLHSSAPPMRADTESLNAQFERAFYNRRLPAWGLHNQTVVVLMAALAQNAWARHTWQRAIDRHSRLHKLLPDSPAIPTSTTPDSVMPTSPLRATKSLPDTPSAAKRAPKPAP